METIIKSITDPYARQARLYPAILTLLPIIVAIAVYTDWLNFDVKNAVLIFLGTAAMFWLAGLSRQLGKSKEVTLIKKWGHLPSVTILRHRDRTIDQHTTNRYHRAAERVAQGLMMPTPQEEKDDPDEADERYLSVTRALLSRTRDTEKHPLIFKELINYGFYRNMLGLKPLALLIAFLLLAYALWSDRNLIFSSKIPDGPELIMVAVTISALLGWILSITENAVKSVAVSYATRLLEALEDTPN